MANENVFFFFPDKDGRAPSPEEITAPMFRVEIDLTRNDEKASTDQITQISVEFGRIDDRVAGKPYTLGFAIGQAFAQWDVPTMGPPHPFFFNTFSKIDVETKEVTNWCPGPTDSVQEPIFIKRCEDAPEGDGYLIGVVNRIKEGSSDLVILDTAKFEEGPIATIKCPFRMRMGLHGNWIDWSA